MNSDEQSLAFLITKRFSELQILLMDYSLLLDILQIALIEEKKALNFKKEEKRLECLLTMRR